MGLQKAATPAYRIANPPHLDCLLEPLLKASSVSLLVLRPDARLSWSIMAPLQPNLRLSGFARPTSSPGPSCAGSPSSSAGPSPASSPPATPKSTTIDTTAGASYFRDWSQHTSPGAVVVVEELAGDADTVADDLAATTATSGSEPETDGGDAAVTFGGSRSLGLRKLLSRKRTITKKSSKVKGKGKQIAAAADEGDAEASYATDTDTPLRDPLTPSATTWGFGLDSTPFGPGNADLSLPTPLSRAPSRPPSRLTRCMSTLSMSMGMRGGREQVVA